MEKIIPKEKIDMMAAAFAKLKQKVLWRQRGSVSSIVWPSLILGDPGADKGGEGKSKRVEKYIKNEEKTGEKSPIVPRGSSRRSLLFFVPHFSARLDFPSSPLSAPGSPRMAFSAQRFSKRTTAF